MKKLTTSTSSQTLSFIPRVYVSSATMKIRDEVKNTTTSSAVSLTHALGYSSLSHAFSLAEGKYYELTILSGSNVIYRDKIFCTDQTIDQDTNSYYTINESQYTQEDSYDNEYITI